MGHSEDIERRYGVSAMMSIFDASRKPFVLFPCTVTVWPSRTKSVRPVNEPEVTVVLAVARTMVKSSMRKLMSRPSVPLRLKLTTGPVIETTGRSSVGGAGSGAGSGGGVGVGAGVSATGGPG